MPCKDTSSKIIVHLDYDDNLIDFEYYKITCSKAIASNSGYMEYCIGKNINEILQWNFSDVTRILNPTNEDEEFLLFLEWDALRAALLQYTGQDDNYNREKYQIAAISFDADSIEIRQTILPPKEMPPVLPCHLAKD